MRKFQRIENCVLGIIFLVVGFVLAGNEESTFKEFVCGMIIMGVGSAFLVLESWRDEKEK